MKKFFITLSIFVAFVLSITGYKYWSFQNFYEKPMVEASKMTDKVGAYNKVYKTTEFITKRNIDSAWFSTEDEQMEIFMWYMMNLSTKYKIGYLSSDEAFVNEEEYKNSEFLSAFDELVNAEKTKTTAPNGLWYKLSLF